MAKQHVWVIHFWVQVKCVMWWYDPPSPPNDLLLSPTPGPPLQWDYFITDQYFKASCEDSVHLGQMVVPGWHMGQMVVHGSNGCTWVTHGSEDQCVELICILLNYSCRFQMLYSLHTFTTTVGLPSSSTKKTQSLLILQNMVPLFLAIQFTWCMTLADKETDLWQIVIDYLWCLILCESRVLTET